ncbi:MAG TPA: calcium-binding protein [Acidimicrobiales bacterium]|nr:calcium-binding protein [Acidimicrobiales bacterium]
MQQKAEFNAGVDQTVQVISGFNLTPAQRDALIAQLEAIRAGANAFFDRLLAVSGCTQPPVCASPPTPPPGAVLAQPGTITFGTSGEDVIYGTSGADRIAGVGGEDLIFGLGGDDQISGGPGDDVICGGDGNDKIGGDTGNDILSGDAGDDDLSGGADNDRLVGGPGTNRLAGGDGDDTCTPSGTEGSQTSGCGTVLANL